MRRMRRSAQALHNGNASAAHTAAPLLFAFLFSSPFLCVFVCLFMFVGLRYFLGGYMPVWWHKMQWIFIWTCFLPSLSSSLSWSSPSPFFCHICKANAILHELPVKPLNVLTENELIKPLILQLDQSTNISFPSEALQRILLLLRPELEILLRYSCSVHTEESNASS